MARARGLTFKPAEIRNYVSGTRVGAVNLASGKFDQIIGNKQIRAQIDAFYSGRNYAPIWITDGNANDRAAAAIAR